MLLTRPTQRAWERPAEYWGSLTAATAGLDTPIGAISLQALAANAFDMLDRVASTTSPANSTTGISISGVSAPAKTIRVASKSVRVRAVIEAVLALPGYAGVLAYTLPEALWLAEAIPDVVVGYPTVDRTAILALATDHRLASRVTIMVDSLTQLDFVDSVIPPGKRESIRVAIELDASWDAPILGHTGVFRSPVHTIAEARTLAQLVVARKGFTLVGMMGYEAQIAGLANAPRSAIRGVAVRWIQRRSIAELAERRGAAVAAVRQIADIEFVNGGGTGSLESTAADPSVTEIAAGSGLFGPHLFDQYAHFSPAPAAAFALSVVRKPRPEMATLLGGGWIASGPSTPDRQPQPEWPAGLSFVPREMAGEVQSPVTGDAARELAVGDRVWLRHTKAGEISEHLNEFAIVSAGASASASAGAAGTGAAVGDTIDASVIEMVPTYRGEGKAFL